MAIEEPQPAAAAAPERPPELLLNLKDLEDRVERYVAHAAAQYDKADALYQRLHQEHCSAAHSEAERWGNEHGRALNLLNMLREARGVRRTLGFPSGGGGGGAR